MIVLGAGLVGAVWATFAGWFRLRWFQLHDLTTAASATVGDTVAVTARGTERMCRMLRRPRSHHRSGNRARERTAAERSLRRARCVRPPWDRRPRRCERPLGRPSGPRVVGASIDGRHRPGRRRAAPRRSRRADRDRRRSATGVTRPARPDRTMGTSTGSGRGATATPNDPSTGRRRCARAISSSSIATAAPTRVGSSASTRMPATVTRKRVAPGGRSTRAGGAVSGPRPRSAPRHRSRSPTPMPRRGGPQRASRIRRRPGRASQARARPEAGLPLAPTARWATAAATFTALTLLVGAIGSSALTIALLAVGTAAGAAVTARVGRSGGELPTFVRLVVALAALGGVASIAAGSGSVSGLLAVLRGPLPQFLMLLVVLHGFECTDRRTARVSLAISAVVASYAAGLRVDGQLGWWLAGWGTCFLSAILADGARRSAGHRVAAVRRSRTGGASQRRPSHPLGARPGGRRARYRPAPLVGPGADRTRHADAPGVHRRGPRRRCARRPRPHRRLDHAARRPRRRHPRRR